MNNKSMKKLDDKRSCPPPAPSGKLANTTPAADLTCEGFYLQDLVRGKRLQETVLAVVGMSGSPERVLRDSHGTLIPAAADDQPD